jgi:TfoX/Sxy family transcriptional regulator of competence genes
VPSAEKLFAALVEVLGARDGVTVGSSSRGFGSDALKVNGRIFAMVSRGRVILKLPHRRVASLIDDGVAVAFDAGKGRPMKEWAAFERLPTRLRMVQLATEALEFVGGTGATSAEKVFDDIAARLLAQTGVERARMFGADGLRSDGSFFAFLSKGRLVVKLPPERRAVLLASGAAQTAESVSPRMRDSWVLVPFAGTAAGSRLWRRLATEARRRAAG